MGREKVLLVDDDSDLVVSLARTLRSIGLSAEVHGVSDPERAIAFVTEEHPAVAVIDLSLNEHEGVESGFSLLQSIHRADATIRVIVLTGHGSQVHGVRAIDLGAANFVEKPAPPHHLRALIEDGIKQAHLRRAYDTALHSDTVGVGSKIVGVSNAIVEIRETLLYAAQTNQSVLITGETGTGKGLSAATIHRLSKRANRSFVRFQPNFSTADLVNSELFGHKKGAFTGAVQDRDGLISDARGGTLFLDEIDELPLETQVTLLGVLQERTYRPLGSNREESSDFRLISAFNKPVEEVLASGRLRHDLFHRIAHLTIHLPALRERPEDVEPTAVHYLRALCDREQLDVRGFDGEALRALTSYSWPGNVRELQHVVEGAAYFAQFKRRSSILPSDLRIVREDRPSSGAPKPSREIAEPVDPGVTLPGRSVVQERGFYRLVDEYERKLIDEALRATGGNQVQAADLLGINRTTLRRILQRG